MVVVELSTTSCVVGLFRLPEYLHISTDSTEYTM